MLRYRLLIAKASESRELGSATGDGATVQAYHTSSHPITGSLTQAARLLTAPDVLELDADSVEKMPNQGVPGIEW